MLVLCLSACSAHEGSSVADRIAAEALAAIQPFHVVKLDTVAIARAVREGKAVRLPFVTQDNRLIFKDVRLTIRNIRSTTLANADVKNGVDKSYRLIRLPPPATYQGWAEGKDDKGVTRKGRRCLHSQRTCGRREHPHRAGRLVDHRAGSSRSYGCAASMRNSARRC